jgi:hypothetical protein
MYNIEEAITGLFYAFMITIGAAVILAAYVLWQALFALTPWDLCAKMNTDSAKVQCMEAHYDR